MVKKKLEVILLPHHPQAFSNMHLVLNISSSTLLPTLLQTGPSCQCYKNLDFGLFSVNRNIFKSRVKSRIGKVACNIAETLRHYWLVFMIGKQAYLNTLVNSVQNTILHSILDKLTENGIDCQTLNPAEPHAGLASSATALSNTQEHCTVRVKKKTGYWRFT